MPAQVVEKRPQSTSREVSYYQACTSHRSFEPAISFASVAPRIVLLSSFIPTNTATT
jgi:hypothetical protein